MDKEPHAHFLFVSITHLSLGVAFFLINKRNDLYVLDIKLMGFRDWRYPVLLAIYS